LLRDAKRQSSIYCLQFMAAQHFCCNHGWEMMGVSRKPNSRDVEIGRDLARQRKAAGTSQAAMAAALGISTQQYGKYERGENRISTSRYEQALGVLHGIQGAVQPGLAEERATCQAQDALLLELESAALALRPALERFLAAVSRTTPTRGSRS